MQSRPFPAPETEDEDHPDVTDPEDPDLPAPDLPHYTDDLPF